MTDHTPLEFDGPPTAYCFGRTYETLTSVGVKREGHGWPEDGAADETEAWARFEAQFSIYKHGATQIAWRTRPYSMLDERGWYIRARLAAFP